MRLTILLASVFFVGCGSSNSNNSPPSAAHIGQLKTMPEFRPSAKLALGGSVKIEASGGVAPYTFEAVAGGMILSSEGNNSAVFKANNSPGTAQIRITDAVGLSSVFEVQIAGTQSGSGVISLSASVSSVQPGESVNLSFSGGMAPYKIEVVTANGGTVDGTSFVSPLNLGDLLSLGVILQVTDSAGNFTQLVITVAQQNESPPEDQEDEPVCQYDGNSYVDQDGHLCEAVGQTLCPSSGVWINQLGQQQACTPGQYINSYPSLPNYPWDHLPNPSSASHCQMYTNQYGVPYVPFILESQYVCVRYDLLQTQSNYSQANFGNYYDYGYDYYFAYPPYSDPSCHTFVDFGGSFGSVAICFGVE